MHNQQMLRSLLAIRSASETMQSLAQPRLAKETTKVIPTTRINTPIPVLDLPFPSDLDATLKTLGLSERGYYEATRKIQEWVLSLQSVHSIHFQHACHDLASLPHLQTHISLATAIENIRVAFQKAYANQLPLMKARILSANSKHSSICKNSKTPFNNEYTPLLELYFEQNAYPSLPDRKLLAKKSMMTMRQIEVWFQNHRARARKEGKVIKKDNSQRHSHLNFESLNKCLPFISATDSTMKPSIDNDSIDDGLEDETCTTPPPIACLFSQNVPPHAFPTTYPPNLPTDPFPNENGNFTFPPPIWMRSQTQSRIQTAIPDMDEFIAMFASKLHLRDGSRRKCDIQHSQAKRQNPCFSPMVVVPAPAPHPALIRAPYINSLSGVIIPLLNPSAPSNLSPSPGSPPKNPHKPRKFAPFLKRTPSALSANHTSNRPDAFSAFASRPCSFSSTASSQSRSSSSSSLSSAEPATPPLSPSQKEQSPLFADHDYQLLDELFGPEPSSQLFNNMAYDTPDLLFPINLQKDIPHNPVYDLSSMFPPALAQVHC